MNRIFGKFRRKNKFQFVKIPACEGKMTKKFTFFRPPSFFFRHFALK